MSEEKLPYEKTMKEQLHGLLHDNMEKYPDAIAWIRKQVELVDLDTLYTEYETFERMLDGTHDNFWNGAHEIYGGDKKVALIKWYRNKTGLGLRESKAACDEWIDKHYAVRYNAHGVSERVRVL